MPIFQPRGVFVFRRPLLVAVALATGALNVAAPAGHAAYPTTGIECQTSSYACTTGGYAGTEPWGYYTLAGSRDSAGRLHNCTSYAAYRAARVGFPKPSWSANANGWDDYSVSRGVQVNASPAVGGVAHWNSGTYGHVAVVERADSGGITITDDNYGSNVTRRVRIPYGSSGWPDSFIHMSSTSPVRFYGDWDGNGTVTVGVVRRVAGALEWHLRNSNSPGPADMIFRYGLASDLPVVGNWDGVGGDTIGIARRTTAGGLEWHLRNYNWAGPANTIFGYGLATDIPVVGNWDGVGGDTVGIARRAAGLEWHLRNYNSAGSANAIFAYGDPVTDMPITGNWDGVGGDTVGIARRTPASGLQWHLRNYNSAGPAGSVFSYGDASVDAPVVGNWDGVGGDTVGVVRVAGGGAQWHLRNYNSAGAAGSVFGYGTSAETFWG